MLLWTRCRSDRDLIFRYQCSLSSLYSNMFTEHHRGVIFGIQIKDVQRRLRVSFLRLLVLLVLIGLFYGLLLLLIITVMLDGAGPKAPQELRFTRGMAIQFLLILFNTFNRVQYSN